MAKALLADGECGQRQFRGALGRFATGVTVVTTRTDAGKSEGVTVSSFNALSLDPPLVVWSLQRRSPSLQSFIESGKFAVNVLAAEQVGLSRHFATPSPDKFAEVAHHCVAGRCPLIDGCIATFECRTDRWIEAGDHVLFIGEVERYACREGDPLIFSAGRYCQPAAIDLFG